MSGPMQFSPSKGWSRPSGNAEPLPEEFKEPSAEPTSVVNAQVSPAQFLAPTPLPAKTAKLTTPNVLKLAKARLKEVKADLKRMKALEQEKQELERLIAAATKPRVAPVRAIKNAG